jgi:hypothetical protein
MAIEFKRNLATFKDVVSIEEAEELLDWFQKNRSGKVDLTSCTHLHPATLQVLMAAATNISAWPKDKILGSWLSTALKSK